MTEELIQQEAQRQLINLDAEEKLIGSLMVYPEHFSEVSLILSDGQSEFWLHRHQYIWNAIEALQAHRQDVNTTTLTDTLERMGLLEEVGGRSYITTLVARAATEFSFNPASYSEIIHDFYVRRKMIEAANEIAASAYNIGKPLTEVQSDSVRAVSDVAILGQSRHMSDFGDVLRDVYNETVQKSHDRSAGIPNMNVIPTGLYDLDRLLDDGLYNGKLYEIANRPGGGKTSFLTQIGMEAAKAGKSVLMFSMEMSAKEVVRRMASQELLLRGRALKTGALTNEEWNLFQDMRRMQGWNITIDDSSSLTPEQIHAKCELVRNTVGLDLILVDYLALMSSGGKRFSKRVEEIDWFARSLKVTAREYDVPLVAANQMNRSIEHRAVESRPVLADLNEGGEKDGDVVIFIHHIREGKEIKSSELIVEKHRDGETGIVPIVFRGEFTRFESASSIRQ
jgi:replicative DNA helicase